MPKKTKPKTKPKTKAPKHPKPKPIRDVDMSDWAAAALRWCGSAATTPAETRRLELTIKCTEMLALEIQSLGRVIESAAVRGA